MHLRKITTPVVGNLKNTANTADTENSVNYGGTANQDTGNTLMKTIV